MTRGLSLLCPLSWDWVPHGLLPIPLPPNPQGQGVFHFPKVSVLSAGLSIWHLPGWAGRRVVWGVG